jgi:hypothetical protein
MKPTTKASMEELGCVNSTESAVSSLPPLPTKTKKPFAWAKNAKATKPKPSLPVVEVKKAAKLLATLGKVICAIEVLPHGGFRVVASTEVVQPTSGHAPNPWDSVLDD